MKARDLLWMLGLETFAIIWAGAAFSLIADRLWAGGVAGLYFIGSAVCMLFWAWRWPDKWRSLMIYPLILHLFGVSLPMVIVRFINAGEPFESVHIWGLEGPQFHRLSTTVFSVLMAATVLDLLRVYWRRRVAARGLNL